MKKAIVIGHFDWKGNDMIGAVVKARSIFLQLQKEYGQKKVSYLDIFEWRNHKYQTIFGLVYAFVKTKNIVLVISDTSAQLMKMLSFLKAFFRRRLFFCAVGGDIADVLIEKGKGVVHLKPIDCFFVETTDCLEQMHDLGIPNCVLMKNFKCLKAIGLSEKVRFSCAPFRFCTFSRVIEQKGISDAIRVIKELNEDAGFEICTLDIYGTIDSSYELQFDQIMNTAKSVKYCGIVGSEKAVEVLSQYYCLLFPTKYQTEGIPGTIIDGFAAGLPVICSDWKRCRQIVEDGVTGIVFAFNDLNDFKRCVRYSIENSEFIEGMRINCVNEFHKYKPEVAIKPLLSSLK